MTIFSKLPGFEPGMGMRIFESGFISGFTSMLYSCISLSKAAPDKRIGGFCGDPPLREAAATRRAAWRRVFLASAGLAASASVVDGVDAVLASCLRDLCFPNESARVIVPL